MGLQELKTITIQVSDDVWAQMEDIVSDDVWAQMEDIMKFYHLP